MADYFGPPWQSCSAGEAENNIMVEQIALTGKLISHTGDVKHFVDYENYREFMMSL